MRAVRDVVIVGAGPAGLTAAVYAARANLAPLVIEGRAAGGQLMLTTDVENYPGFPDGVLGPDLMQKFRMQAERFGAEFLTSDVDEIDLRADPFRLITDTQVLLSRSVILATGASARLLGLANEARLLGRGVSTCATCDGFFFRNDEIAVIGGGDSAIEEANFLTRFATAVTVIHRRHALRASKIMQERAFANPKITFAWNSVVDDVLGEDTVSGLRLRHVRTGRVSDLAVTGVFVAIGHEPNTRILAGQVALDSAGYVVTDTGTRTSVEGVFACGDVQDHVYRQAITAAGSGCIAAIEAERFLQTRALRTEAPSSRQGLMDAFGSSHRPASVADPAARRGRSSLGAS